MKNRNKNNYSQTVVSLVTSARETRTQNFTIEEIISRIKSGDGRFKTTVDSVRASKPEEAAELKRSLPAILFSGTFSRRSKAGLIDHSGVICMDFDKIEGAASKSEELKFDPHVVASFVSPSGNGLKVLVAIPKGDPEDHEVAFGVARDYMAAVYSLNADESGKDVSRLCFLSYDPNAYFCPEAVELPVAEIVLPASRHEPTGGDRIGDRYMASPDIRERSRSLLVSNGWKVGSQSSDRTICTRPNKERGASGTLFDNGSFYCFTDNAPPLAPSTSYSPFALLAEFNFSGNFKEAALSLADEFGEPSANISSRDRFNKSPDKYDVETSPEAPEAPADPNWFPEFRLASDIPDDIDKRIAMKYPVLVDGLLQRGTKMVFGGGSKSYKTWTLLNLAISVAAGVPWLGREVVKTDLDVIFINFEVTEEMFESRVKKLCTAMGVDRPSNLKLLHLRGICNDLSVILEQIQPRIADGSLALIVIDPIYKALGDRDENAAGDMGLLMNEVEALVARTGAAAAFAAHYSKGNQAEKDPLDRISGSGVFARDPDTIMGLTAHEEEGCFTVHSSLRNFPSVDPFVIEWNFPLWSHRDDLDANKLKKAGQKVSKGKILKAIKECGAAGADPKEFIPAQAAKHDVTERTIYRLVKTLCDEKKAHKTAGHVFASS